MSKEQYAIKCHGNKYKLVTVFVVFLKVVTVSLKREI